MSRLFTFNVYEAWLHDEKNKIQTTYFDSAMLKVCSSENNFQVWCRG